MIVNKNIGSDFDDFLKDEGILADVEAVATKRVISFQIMQAMQRNHLTKTVMASRMKTSRAAVNRILDPMNTAVTLKTMEQAATAVGKRLRVTLEDDSHDVAPFAGADIMEALAK